jgi:hypothetical protein
MLDFFPTAIALVGLPPIPKCTCVDQPPTVLCLQGESYADEFIPALSSSAGISSTPKQYIFSQWPYKPPKGSKKPYRMGYTIRSEGGFRLTQYVPYDVKLAKGNWLSSVSMDDLELYDYNTDPDERYNQATNPKHADVVKTLLAVLKGQYSVRASTLR